MEGQRWFESSTSFLLYLEVTVFPHRIAAIEAHFCQQKYQMWVDWPQKWRKGMCLCCSQQPIWCSVIFQTRPEPNVVQSHYLTQIPDKLHLESDWLLRETYSLMLFMTCNRCSSVHENKMTELHKTRHSLAVFRI